MTILEFRFDRSNTMCRAFQRMCHYYEIPGFIGEFKSWEEHDAYYGRHYNNPLAWANMYAGANLPDVVVEAFAGRDDLNDDEKKIISRTRGINGKHYVIATANNALYVRDHEIAHALYYLNSKYKKEVDDLLLKRKDLEPLVKHLKLFYDKKTLLDEIHAYLATYTRYLDINNIPYPQDLANELNQIYNLYAINAEITPINW